MSSAIQEAVAEKSAGERMLRQSVDSIVQTWQQWSTAQQQRAFIIGAIGLLVVGALLWWASTPSWRVLYSGLAPDDSRQIATLLSAAGLQYDVSADGTTLRVPTEVLDKARLTTAAKASGKSGRLGFEIFDKPNWAGSDFDEKVNYQRALEGELEHTIDTLADVQSSRVHLVMPHDALFEEQQRDAKASVVLRLKSTRLSDAEADSIRNLVASAVDDLQPDHVVLVDADGHSPLAGKNAAADANAAYELALSDHIVQTLEPVAGEGNVRATVTVDYDSSSSDEVDEKYDPASVVNLSMQRSEEVSGGQTPPTGVPGTASNAPNQQPPLFPSKQSSAQSTKQESGTYAASKKTVHLLQGPGRLRRITAAVLVNDRIADRSVVPSKKDGAAQQPWTAAQLQQLLSLSQAAVGYDPTRGDQVVVQNLRFQTPVPESAKTFQKFLQNAGTVEPALKYATIAGISLVFLLVVVRPALTRQQQPVPRSAAGLPSLPGQVKDPGTETQAAHAQALFGKVVDHIQRDPAQSARILQTWIKSE